tara:strand:- start:6728 stop:6967 length:240 start_codon:yes stop_codon:yes gene_type:complete
MAITRDEDWAQLYAWTEIDTLRRHSRSVEGGRRPASLRYGAAEHDVESRCAAGMLPGADHETWTPLAVAQGIVTTEAQA